MKYEVCVEVQGFMTIEVEADSFDEAKEIGLDEVRDCELSRLYPEYCVHCVVDENEHSIYY